MKRFVWSALILIIPLAFAASPALAQRYNPAINPPAPPLNTLTDQEKADGWQLLFNGEDFEGWEWDREGIWKINDGIIFSANGSSHLFSKKKFQNLELSWDVCAYDVGVPEDGLARPRMGNSGVFVRCVKTGGSFPKGYEIQVDPYDVKNPTGGIYGCAPGSLLVDEDGNWKKEAFFEVHEGKWIHQRVRVEGSHFQIWVNGKKTLDWVDEDNAFPEPGFVALQNHHPTDVVLFTNIKIKELD
ncbi:MAG: DUF1080 domain-containing protein [Candidatus Omnitrophica bacterium]|nr:DUF1080 domain-containing protein [Candidatus Omnitrophota bacterium]